MRLGRLNIPKYNRWIFMAYNQVRILSNKFEYISLLLGSLLSVWQALFRWTFIRSAFERKPTKKNVFFIQETLHFLVYSSKLNELELPKKIIFISTYSNANHFVDHPIYPRNCYVCMYVNKFIFLSFLKKNWRKKRRK